MIHVLVSACLLGENCKWDGGNNRNEEVLALIKRLEKEAEFHPVCPERLGGLLTPRPASEILRSCGAVVNTKGCDVTREFLLGAKKALELAREFGCGFALLKERSPSCGSGVVYDGSFSHKTVDGMGKAAELLSESGVRVYGESMLGQLEEALLLETA